VTIDRFPHCDERVLHAPGECEYCDHHPEWQELRRRWGIAFTGHAPDPALDELSDPAVIRRPLAAVEAWSGNIRRIDRGPGWRMCCICFEAIKIEDLWVDSTGITWDMCKECGAREGAIAEDGKRYW
jgi:hypothetical protein